MYEARGFQPIEVPGRYTVMPRPVRWCEAHGGDDALRVAVRIDASSV